MLFEALEVLRLVGSLAYPMHAINVTMFEMLFCFGRFIIFLVHDFGQMTDFLSLVSNSLGKALQLFLLLLLLQLVLLPPISQLSSPVIDFPPLLFGHLGHVSKIAS